jgi:WD40 repeat protein/HAMP domain-containing protein
VFFWKKSLMAQLVLYFLLLSLITVSFGVSIAYYQAQRALRQSVEERLTAAATLKENEFNRWVEDQRQALEAIAELPAVENQARRLLYAELLDLPLETAVWSVSFSPDGRIVSTGYDYTVRVWDSDGNKSWPIETDAWASQFSPDGRYLIIQGSDNVLRIYDSHSQEQIKELFNPIPITSWVIAPDSRHLAYGNDNGEVFVWKVEDGTLVSQFTTSTETINDVVFSPDGRYLAVASNDYSGSVWEAATGQEIAAHEHEGWVFTIAFSPDGRWLATSSEDKTASIWDATTGEEIWRLPHNDWVNVARFSPDGRWLATASYDKTTVIWDTATGQPVTKLGSAVAVKNLRWSPNGQYLASWEDNNLWLRAVTGWQLIQHFPLELFSNEPEVVNFSHDSRLLAAASQSGQVSVWQTDSGADHLQLEHDTYNYATLSTYLLAINESQADLQEILLLNLDGKILVSTDKSHEGLNIAERNYFRAGRQNTHIENIYPSPETGKPTLSIATPLYNPVGETIGVMITHLNLDRLNVILNERTGLGESGRTYLVSARGQIVSGSRYGTADYPFEVNSAGIAAALRHNNAIDLYTNYQGTPVIGVYRWLAERNLALMAEMDQQEGFAPARRLATNTFMVMLALVFLLAIGIYLLARQIAEPILAITKSAKQVEAEVYVPHSLTAVAGRADELGALARVFEQMAQVVYEREERLKQEVIQLRVEIDETRKAHDVAQITKSDYFRELQQKARAIREQNSQADDPTGAD